jgi:hypothetical protein
MAPGPPPPVPAAPKGKMSTARKASPPRADTEKTFQQKLDEIKRQRATSTNVQERRRVIVNGKPSLAVCGDWALFASSSGRQYYFNLTTLVNQWQKPDDWCDVKAGIASPASDNGPPPLPPQGTNSLSDKPPPPPTASTDSQANGGSASFKMKIKSHGKHKLKHSDKLQDEGDEDNEEKNRLPPGKVWCSQKQLTITFDQWPVL